jgi:putative membrane protein
LLLAHGPSPSDPGLWFLEWPVEPFVWLICGAAAWWYLRAARRIAGWSPWRRRSYLAGVGVVALALAGPPAAFDTDLFWVHMVQHLLLVIVAVPLILVGAPMTLALRTGSDRTRGVLRSLSGARPIRALGNPIVAWAGLAAVMVITHFSPMYNAALENEFVHVAEHTLFLSAALLFWWPVVGLDPGSRRLGWPLRAVYIALTMPLQAFIGLALYSSDRILYHHYATLNRTWGPTPLEDQRLAGVVMWVGGEFLTVAALAAVIVAWMRHEERLAANEDRRLGLT